MKDIWDKLLASVPIDKKAMIVTDWNESVTSLEINNHRVLFLDVPKMKTIARKLTSYYHRDYNEILNTLANGHGYDSFDNMIGSFKRFFDYPTLGLAELKSEAWNLRDKHNIKYQIALNIIAVQQGHKNFHQFQNKIQKRYLQIATQFSSLSEWRRLHLKSFLEAYDETVLKLIAEEMNWLEEYKKVKSTLKDRRKSFKKLKRVHKPRK